MWIQGVPSTRRMVQKEFDDDGQLVAVHEADFNHNGRAEVSDKTGKWLIKQNDRLKAVKDGGPPLPKEADPESAKVTEKESTDAE